MPQIISQITSLLPLFATTAHRFSCLVTANIASLLCNCESEQTVSIVKERWVDKLEYLFTVQTEFNKPILTCAGHFVFEIRFP